MDLNGFRQIIESMASSGDFRENAEQIYHRLEDTDPGLLISLHIQNISSKPQHSSIQISSIALGRSLKVIHQRLPQIGDQQFHDSLRSELLDILSRRDLSEYVRIQIASAISTLSSEYSSFLPWSDLPLALLSIASTPNIPALECLSQCFNNHSISPAQFSDQLFSLFTSVFSHPTLSPSLRSASLCLLYSTLNTTDSIQFFLQFSQAILQQLSAASPSELTQLLSNLFYFLTESFINFIDPILDQFAALLSSFASNQQLSIGVRSLSLNLLSSLIQLRSTHFYASIGQFFTLFVNCLCEFDDATENLSLEESIVSTAEDVVSEVAELYKGSNDFRASLLDLFETYYQSGSTQSRTASWLLMKNFIGPCRYILVDCTLEPFLGPLFESASDSNQFLRKVAFEAFAEALWEDSASLPDTNFYEEIWPNFFVTVKSESALSVLKPSLKGVECFCKNFSSVVCKNLSDLIVLYLSVFQSLDNEGKCCILRSLGFLSSKVTEAMKPFIDSSIGIAETIISDFCHEYDRSVFFECVKVFPKYGIPLGNEQFQPLAYKCVSLIAELPIPELIDSEVIIIIKTLKRLTERYDELKEPCFSKVFEMVFNLLLHNIDCEEVSFSEKLSNNSDQFCVPFQSESIVRVYKTSQIHGIIDGLKTLNSLMPSSKSFLFAHASVLIEIVEKWLTSVNHSGIILAAGGCAQALINILDFSQNEGKDAFLAIFNLLLKAFEIISDVEDLIDFVVYLRSYFETYVSNFQFDSQFCSTLSSFVGKHASLCQTRYTEKKAKEDVFDDNDESWNKESDLEIDLVWLARYPFWQYPNDFQPMFLKCIAPLYDFKSPNLATFVAWSIYMRGSPNKENAGECLNLATSFCCCESYTLRKAAIRLLGYCIGSGAYPPQTIYGSLPIIQQFNQINKENGADASIVDEAVCLCLVISGCSHIVEISSFCEQLVSIFPIKSGNLDDISLIVSLIIQQLTANNQVFLRSENLASIRGSLKQWHSKGRIPNEYSDAVTAIIGSGSH